MSDKGSKFLFNTIAPVYGLFFDYQVRKYRKLVHEYKSIFNKYEKALDIGCGTGALCFVLNELEMEVTGVDPAEKMLRIAKHKNKPNNNTFVQLDILERLPFEDKSFDITIASFVAHGMKVNDRLKMYEEMNRLTKHKVIFYDYNTKRRMLSDIVEWLENGDYFNFIQYAEKEMKDYFKDVEIINVDTMASLYVCTPHQGMDKSHSK